VAVILDVHSATIDFLRKHYYLFQAHIDPETLKGTVTPLENVHVPDLFDAQDTVDWESGCTEPWIVDVVCALLVANRAERVIEIGGFTGFASKRLARALNTLRRGEFVVCEIEPARAQYVQTALDALRLPFVGHTVIADDSLRWLPTLADESVDFAWLDGDHAKEHVRREIELLLPKLRAGGLICGHDVFGVTDLQEVFRAFGGYALDLPRLGPAGGLGILQVA
jgi:predicted O-methyltransferase YrrM